MPQIPAKRTVATADEMRTSFESGWPHERYTLTPEILALLLALSDFETGVWGAMYNWNPGNIVPGDQYDGDWHTLTDSAGRQLRFRSYPSRDAGAAALIAQLLSDSRPEWRAGLLTGDPTTFVDALGGRTGGRKYYEADRDTYLTRFLGRWSKYRPLAITPASHSPLNPLFLLGGMAIAVVVIRRRKRR